MGRPKATVDVELIKKLASIHCPMDEIASITGLHKRTLERRFAAVIQDARNTGKMSLRRKQVEVAMAGNPQMLVWLGKVYLGQKDTTRLELTDEIVDTYLSRKNAADADSAEVPGVEKK